jgi:F0F1-type ATP synthase assembly protein I
LIHVPRVASLPPDDSQDGRSAAAIAYAWAWRVIAISLEMVVPGLAGYWIDMRLGTKALFMILGFVAGMTLAILHLVRIARGPSKSSKS